MSRPKSRPGRFQNRFCSSLEVRRQKGKTIGEGRVLAAETAPATATHLNLGTYISSTLYPLLIVLVVDKEKTKGGIENLDLVTVVRKYAYEDTNAT